MLAYGWHRLGARKFLAKIGDDNAASLGMFKGLGFEFEKHSEAFKQTTLAWSPKVMERPRIEPCVLEARNGMERGVSGSVVPLVRLAP